MSKVKNWAYDEVEHRVNLIAQALKDGICTKQEAIDYVLQLDHIQLLDINQDNVSEYLDCEVANA